eukprot:313854-Rhodomonas_salina.7
MLRGCYVMLLQVAYAVRDIVCLSNCVVAVALLFISLVLFLCGLPAFAAKSEPAVSAASKHSDTTDSECSPPRRSGKATDFMCEALAAYDEVASKSPEASRIAPHMRLGMWESARSLEQLKPLVKQREERIGIMRELLEQFDEVRGSSAFVVVFSCCLSADLGNMRDTHHITSATQTVRGSGSTYRGCTHATAMRCAVLPECTHEHTLLCCAMSVPLLCDVRG